MDNGTQKSNPSCKNTYPIGGISVEFPYQPYGSQFAFMGRVISTLDRGQRQGHCHALLESPTGTGKSLSLLCSALAWQQNYKSKNLYSNFSLSKPAPEAAFDPLGYGGGFIPETQPPNNGEPDPSAKNSKTTKKKVPTIFYASRTHSQISQVIREYRKTSYRVPMAVLASRKHYCTNKNVCGKANIDEECKTLLKENSRDAGGGCLEFRNVHKVKGHPSIQKGGCNEAHDIEDLVKVGRLVKGCSYFAAQAMSEEAQLVFCPYSYIINSVIRGAMNVELKDSIVILDEAHNIEDMARDGGSVDVEEDVLYTLHTELGQLYFGEPMIYQPLYETIQGIISWMGQRKSTLEKREFQHYVSCWTGDKALKELQEAGVSQQCFPIFQECVIKAIKAASEAESGVARLSGKSVIILEGLFSSLGYFFSGNGLHTVDYQLALRKYIKRDGNNSGEWTHSFSLWCLNPAVVFKEIADLSMSVILTSGTLSPMSSFSSELGVQFETCMEAPHVIDVKSQLWSAVVSTGPRNYPLNASYKTADAYAFQDELGASLEQICKIVPGGALVFFPSYRLMEKLCTRWEETGQWSRLNAQKSLFVEPKGDQEAFESVLKDYYNTIRQGKKPAPCTIKKGKSRGLNHYYSKESQKHSGAALLAVCRGKVSEGIDFSDENARVVVIVGIPFPNIHDIQVAQKKKYNDTYSSSRKLQSGSQWYCHQAFRALNQAAGRCIRHRFDYGAIIFMDERFKEERNTAYVSKWLRKSIKQYASFGESMEGLQSFFQDVKEKTKQEDISSLEISVIKEEAIPVTKQRGLREGVVKRKNTDCKIGCSNGENVVSNNMIATGKARRLPRSLNLVRTDEAPLPKSNVHVNAETTEFDHADDTVTVICRDCVDSECSAHIDSRSERKSMASSIGSPEQSTFVGNLHIYDTISISSPSAGFSKEDTSSSSMVKATNEISDQLSVHSASVASSYGPLSEGTYAMDITPERLVDIDFQNLKPEMESYMSLSVNSHTQKRRRAMSSELANSVMDEFRTPDGKPQNSMECSGASRDANRRIEFGFEADSAVYEYNKSNVSETVVANSFSPSSLSSTSEMGKRLNICCSFCKSSLGLPENQYLVTCLMTSSSKSYLQTFLENGLEHGSINEPKSIPVVICDPSLVDQRLCLRPTSGTDPKNSIWSEQDGCVFSTVFCPFCTVSNHFLGLQVMATDASNVQLLNKLQILFYADRLEIKNLEAPKDEPCLPVGSSEVGQTNYSLDVGQFASDRVPQGDQGIAIIDRFSYTQQQDSGGWRTTKSKLRLPKRSFQSQS